MLSVRLLAGLQSAHSVLIVQMHVCEKDKTLASHKLYQLYTEYQWTTDSRESDDQSAQPVTSLDKWLSMPC